MKGNEKSGQTYAEDEYVLANVDTHNRAVVRPFLPLKADKGELAGSSNIEVAMKMSAL